MGNNSRNTLKILNGHFDIVDMESTIQWIVNQCKNSKSSYLCTVNVAILMMMRANPRLQSFVENSGLVVADGTPILWAAKLLGRSLPQRVTGVDMIAPLCEAAVANNLSVYLLGAEKHIVNAVHKKLGNEFPKLHIAGVADGYFNAAEAATRANAVKDSKANIVIIGMGVPRQEYFIEEYLEQMGTQVAIGVGGSFDVVAGLRKRAPKALQKTGLEWLYRLAQEPRRLFWRYLVTNTQFISLMFIRILSPKKIS